MELKLLRTMWGVLDFTNPKPHDWEPLFQKLQKEGYSGIEIPMGPFNPFQSDKTRALELFKKYGFVLVGQIHTCSYPVSSRKIEDHFKSFCELVHEAQEWGAIFVNSHSGTDAWNFAQASEFFEKCLAFESSLSPPIKILHETHRQRVLYNPWITRDLLQKHPNLKINADLSHWCCVAGRVFDDEGYDTDWKEIITLVAERCHLVHARVGYSEGPQVPHPAAPEYKTELDAHIKWWTIIWKAQQQRGDGVSYVEPEFGPPPYLHTLPYSNVPVADLWQVNSWMGKKVAEVFPHKQ